MTILLSKVRIDGDQIIIDANQIIYGRQNIFKTAEIFKEYCDVAIKDRTAEIVQITLKPKQEPASESTGYEFFNYLLSMVKDSYTAPPEPRVTEQP